MKPDTGGGPCDEAYPSCPGPKPRPNYPSVPGGDD